MKFLARIILLLIAVQLPKQAFAQAEIDLSNWDGKSTLQLKGPWDFYWQELTEPGQPWREPDLEMTRIRRWTGVESAIGEKFGSEGYGSYRVALKGLRSRADGYEIQFKGIHSAAIITLYSLTDPNAESIQTQVGVPDSELTSPSNRTARLSFFPQTDHVYEMIIQVSNHQHVSGGIGQVPRIGPPQAMKRAETVETLGQAASMGLILAVAVYSLLIYLRRREDHASLALAGLCLATLIRAFSTSDAVADLLPESASTILRRFAYMSMPPMALLGIYFLRGAFFSKSYVQFSRILSVIALTLMGYAFLSSAVQLSSVLVAYQLYVLFVLLSFIWMLSHAIIRKMEGAGIVLTGVIIGVAGGFFDIVVTDILALTNFFITPMTTSIFLLFQSQLVARRSAAAYARAETFATEVQKKNEEITFFNKNLEKLVEQKTKEVRSLLDHIPQGVLSIGEDGLLDKDFSAHLRDVIACDEIAEQSFKDIILDRSNLSSDLRDQAWQTIMVCIGQHELNFETNVSRLPTEIPMQIGEQERILKATWNALLEGDEVQKILVTLLDVTTEKALAKEAAKQQKELELIQELLELSSEKATQFFLTSEPLLEEARNLIEIHNGKIPVAVVRTLFVNAHTVKGAARTLGLKELAKTIHDMENYYSTILKSDVPIDPERIRKGIQASIQCLHKYREINHQKLNRSEDYSKLSVDRSFIESHYYLIKDLLTADEISSQDIISILNRQSDELIRIIFEQLDHVINSYEEKACKIAKDLGKEAPVLKLNLEEVSISAELRTTLDNCMIHLLRNSLDHGIETAEERAAQQKPGSGTISIDAYTHEGKLHIKIEDDGRGLALGRLYRKALENGNISSNASSQEVAETIFTSGMSTAEEVSMYSGRGVGMAAVRSFLEKSGGQIAVVIKDDICDPGQVERVPFHFHIILPLDQHGELRLPSAS